MSDDIETRIKNAKTMQEKLAQDLLAAENALTLLQAEKDALQKIAQQKKFLETMEPLTIQLASFMSYYCDSRVNLFNNYYTFRYAGIFEEHYEEAMQSLNTLVKNQPKAVAKRVCKNATELFAELLSTDLKYLLSGVWRWNRFDMDCKCFRLILGALNWNGQDWVKPSVPFAQGALHKLKHIQNDPNLVHDELLKLAGTPGFLSRPEMIESFKTSDRALSSSISEFADQDLFMELCRRNASVSIPENCDFKLSSPAGSNKLHFKLKSN